MFYFPSLQLYALVCMDGECKQEVRGMEHGLEEEVKKLRAENKSLKEENVKLKNDWKFFKKMPIKK